MNVPAAALTYSVPRALLVPVADRPQLRNRRYWIPQAPAFTPHLALSDRGLGITRSNATSMALNMTGTSILSYAPAAGPMAPFVAAAGAVAVLAGQIAKIFSGCGATCVQATDAANQWADAVHKVTAQYWGTPTPRPKSFQKATLDTLDQAAQWLQTACGDPQLGNAGKRCISERLVRGGTAPWCPTADHTGCDFYTVDYDPIKNDPDVVDDSTFGVDAATAQTLFGVSTGSTSDLATIGLILGGLGLVFLL